MAALRFRLGAAAGHCCRRRRSKARQGRLPRRQDRAGCDPREVATSSASSPRGGLHVIYKASKPYKNAVAIDGTALDLRALGGYVVLPLPGNGREWLKPLIGASLLPAPAWLDYVVRKAPSTRAPLTLAPRSALAPASSDSWAQKKARNELSRACVKIVTAPCGAQDTVRHRMCFYIGGLVARGDLGYEEAFGQLSSPRPSPAPVHRAGRAVARS